MNKCKLKWKIIITKQQIGITSSQAGYAEAYEGTYNSVFVKYSVY